MRQVDPGSNPGADPQAKEQDIKALTLKSGKPVQIILRLLFVLIWGASCYPTGYAYGVAVAGDIDNSGSTDLSDAILAIEVLIGMDTAGRVRPDYADSGADVNGDDRVGVRELIYILQTVAGLRPESTTSTTTTTTVPPTTTTTTMTTTTTSTTTLTTFWTTSTTSTTTTTQFIY